MYVFNRERCYLSEGGKPQVRHVEITYTAHYVKNYLDIVKSSTSPTELKNMVEAAGGPIVVNYRFIREYTKGVEDSWTLNALNHFYLKEAE